MDQNEMLKKLFKIAQTQQKVLEKLAQAMPPAPMPMNTTAPAAAPGTPDQSAKLQQAVYALMPEAKNLFVEPPTVGHTAGPSGKPTVFYKYRASKNDQALKAAVVRAADGLLGAGNYLIQSVGEMA